MNTGHIKNLAIAYEALSRCAGAEEHLDKVNGLLGYWLREAEKEQKAQTPTDRDDEIPF